MKRVTWAIGFMVAASVLLSCKTRPPVEEAEVAEAPVAFQPSTAVSQLHFDQGNYPNLFAPSSYAVWVDEAVTKLRREAAVAAGESVTPETDAESARINADYVVCECHIESMFADMSIAYDAVGCRGVSVYLALPDGRKIPPIQTLIGTSAKEEQHEALKLFGRTNLLVFPKRDLWLNKPLIATDVTAVRLVLEGYNSTFYFEWPAAPSSAAWTVSDRDMKQMLMTGFREFHERVRQLAHIFD